MNMKKSYLMLIRKAFGGYELAERKVIRFGNEESLEAL